MILDKYVKVKINPSNYNYLLSKGYENFKKNDIIPVKVEDLSNGSNVLVNCKCDICGLEKKLNYRFYLKNIKKYNIFTCYKCSKIKVKKTSLENYGVDNPLKSIIIKDKMVLVNCLNIL